MGNRDDNKVREQWRPQSSSSFQFSSLFISPSGNINVSSYTAQTEMIPNGESRIVFDLYKNFYVRKALNLNFQLMFKDFTNIKIFVDCIKTINNFSTQN